MRASKRSLKGLLVLLVLATMIIPGMASAAAPNPVSDVIVFGNKVPEFGPWGVNGDPGWNDPVRGYNTVFPSSKPFDQVSLGGVYYMGVADPDTIVDIEITDGVTTFSTATWTAPTGSTTAIDGYNAGWFGLHVPSGFPRPTQDDNNVIYVTDLGVHKAELDLTINPDGSASTNPAHWGPSAITFKFTARNPTTNETSATVTRTITKYAATPDDVTAPAALFANQWRYPPAHWCHTGAPGANFPTQSGQHLGGTEQGQCSSFAQAPIGALPDLTWAFCIREVSNPHHLIDPSLPANPFRSSYCRFDPNRHTPHGEAVIQGFVTDAPAAARGLSSEIQSVSVQVFQGSTMFLDLTPNTTTYRQGPTLGWGVKLRIQDLEANWPTGDLYQIRIAVQDAWGRSTSFTSPNITVYPY